MESAHNPYAGRYEPDLTPFMTELRSLGLALAQELVDTLGHDQVEVYSKAAIVGVNGEMEHGAVWHEAGGWAMREALGEPKAIVPSAKVVAATGYRLVAPLHYSRRRSNRRIGRITSNAASTTRLPTGGRTSAMQTSGEVAP